MNCDAPVHVKRAYAEQLPPHLVKKHGKRKHYTREQILDAITSTGLPVDHACWAMALFEHPDLFAAFHRVTDDVCDYSVMHAEMVTFIPTRASEAWSLFDWDWFSFDVFDWFDWAA